MAREGGFNSFIPLLRWSDDIGELLQVEIHQKFDGECCKSPAFSNFSLLCQIVTYKTTELASAFLRESYEKTMSSQHVRHNNRGLY